MTAVLESKPWYHMKIFIGGDDEEIVKRYKDAAAERNDSVKRYHSGELVHIDAGFDLFCPEEYKVSGGTTAKINHSIKCSMTRMGDSMSGQLPVAFYLYPRSSTGTKTPLRLSNSVGIIDSGYRGNIIAAVDNWKDEHYVIRKYDRIVQICPPDLSYPVQISIVSSEECLVATLRGEDGFGSSGR
jgi:dUTP pyrophosphatase